MRFFNNRTVETSELLPGVQKTCYIYITGKKEDILDAKRQTKNYGIGDKLL